MAKVPKIGAGLLKHAPWMAVVLAIYQYYKDTGGLPGFLADIKNIRMSTLETHWQKVAIGIALFTAAEVISRWVPGKMKYLVKGIMYYFGASQILEVVNVMYTPPIEPAAQIDRVYGAGGEVRGY